MAWHVYMMRCRDGSLYTGITTDIEKRLKAHNAGTASKYTRTRRPVVLAWSKKMRDESAARKREVKLKRLTKAEKEALIA